MVAELTTSLDLKVHRRIPVVPFCTITSGSACISIADVGLVTVCEHKTTSVSTQSSKGSGLNQHHGQQVYNPERLLVYFVVSLPRSQNGF